MARGTETDAVKRGRKPKDPQLILDALEALLTGRPLHELHVEDILERAGVARATFYSHFATKHAAAAALFDRALEDIATSTAAFVHMPEGRPPMEALREGIDDGTAVWFRHRVILQTVIQNAHVVPEFGQTLARIKRQYADTIAGQLERQRAAGLAPPGADARKLTAALVECTIHLLYTASLGDTKGIPGRRGIADVIMAIWSGTLYRVEPPAR
jgi:AcrR family transcriptional regulator